MSGAQRDIGRGRSGLCRCRRPEGARGDRQRRARDGRRGGTNGERHLGGWLGGVWIRLVLKGESQSGQRRGSVREDAQCVARDVVERKEERRAKPSALQTDIRALTSLTGSLQTLTHATGTFLLLQRGPRSSYQTGTS